MKTILILAAMLSGIVSTCLYAQKNSATKQTIKVWGNCGMCKTTIEKAAKKAGAATATWSEQTHELKVTYAAQKTNSQKIQQAIAAAGYDTQDETAITAVYNKLHSCCKYERKATTPIMVTQYVCSMHATEVSDKVGKCTKCGMDLILKN
jgi:periplasmic mercuric ion binding protein